MAVNGSTFYNTQGGTGPVFYNVDSDGSKQQVGGWRGQRDLLNGGDNDLSELTTTTKANLVDAINEVKSLIGSGGTPIDLGNLLPTFGIARTIDSFKQLGDVDDTSAFQRAFDYARDNRTKVVGVPGKSYTLSNTVTAYANYGAFDGQGCILSWPVFSGQLLRIIHGTITGAPADDDTKSPMSRSIQNFGIVGPGRAANGSKGIVFGDQSFGTSVKNFRVSHVDVGLTWESNSFVNVVSNFEINHVNRLGLFPAGLTNAGERITFTNGTCSNSEYGFEFNSCQAQINNVSFDYLTLGAAIVAKTGAAVYTQLCHFEGNQNVSYLFWEAYNGSMITNHNATIAIGAPATGTRTLPVGFADISTRASINFTGSKWVLQLGNGFGTMPALVDGSGVDCTNGFYNNGFPNPPSHTRRNMFSDGGVNSGYLRDFINTSNGSGIVAIVAEGVTGSAIKLAPSVGLIGRIEACFSVVPGAEISLAFMAKMSAANTDGMYISHAWKDRWGQDVGTPQFNMLTGVTTTYSLQRWQPLVRAPNGAAFLRIAFGKAPTGSTSEAATAGDATGYLLIDDLAITGVGAESCGTTSAYRGFNVRTLTAGATLNRDSVNYVDTTTAAFTVSLPGNANKGDTCMFIDQSGATATNNLTVSGNIRGVASTTAVLNIAYGVLTFRYTGTTWTY